MKTSHSLPSGPRFGRFPARRSPVAQAAALAAMLLTAGLLGGCGGGQEADSVTGSNASLNGTSPETLSSSSPTTASLAVSGRVMNVGYLANTPVCLDLDHDGACGSADVNTTTDAAGRYSLSAPVGQRGASLLAVVTPGTSSDTASTTEAPVNLRNGWVLANLLEYAEGATAATVNVSPATTTYYARMHSSGRNRLSTRIAMFTRLYYTTNLNPDGSEKLAMDFDYVASPPADDATYGSLASRLRALSAYLSEPAANASHPANTRLTALSLLETAGVMNAWYNTWTNASATAAGIPADAAKINALTTTNLPAAYIAAGLAKFNLWAGAAEQLRGELIDTASIGGYTWYRDGVVLKYINTLGLSLNSGAVYRRYQRLAQGSWSDLSAAEESLTLDRAGKLTLMTDTDALQARTVTYTDGNRLTWQLPGSGARQALETASALGSNGYIDEWLAQQSISYTNYYSRSSNTTAIATPTVAPACYSGTATAAATWFSGCVTALRSSWAAANGGSGYDVSVDGANTTARAEYYDVTLLEPRVDFPLSATCGSGTDAATGAAITLPAATVLGRSLCNWAVDNQASHSLPDLFKAEGVQINSGSKYYGVSTYTASATAPCEATGATSGACTLPAPTAADQGLPVRLKLVLNRSGGETSGSGTLTSEVGAWSSTSNTAKTETIAWEISMLNPNLLLISYPFRNAGDPRANTATVSTATVVAGTEASPTLTAHFSTSIAPTTHTSPNYRKFAILLQDGVFVTGYHYGAGFTEAERYVNKRTYELGTQALQWILAQLHAAGFQ